MQQMQKKITYFKRKCVKLREYRTDSIFFSFVTEDKKGWNECDIRLFKWLKLFMSLLNHSVQ